MHIIHRGLTHLAPNAIASIAACSASLASSILRCLCRSLRWRSFSFLPPPAGCCASLAASAQGNTTCTTSSTVMWWPALADGSVLERLLSPRDVLASPLMLPAKAALLALPPPAGWGSVCCVSLAASAAGCTGCAASSSVMRWPALADGSVLERLPSPREVLASPLLLPAAAALLDGPPPPPLALPLPFCCAPSPRAHHALS
jgi:hypothetical protein